MYKVERDAAAESYITLPHAANPGQRHHQLHTVPDTRASDRNSGQYKRECFIGSPMATHTHTHPIPVVVVVTTESSPFSYPYLSVPTAEPSASQKIKRNDGLLPWTIGNDGAKKPSKHHFSLPLFFFSFQEPNGSNSPRRIEIIFFERAVRVHQKQRHLLFFSLPNKYHVDMIGLDLTQLSALTKKKCG